MTFQPANTNSVFLPTTIQYPEDPKELLNRLNKAYEDTATRLNTKEIGIYDQIEFLTGQQWYTVGIPRIKRQTFRKVFNLGAIATGATLTTAHNITQITAFTAIYGTCVTDVVDYRPIPYASATAVNQQLEIKVTATNIVIISGAAAPNITSAIVVLEFLKN